MKQTILILVALIGMNLNTSFAGSTLGESIDKTVDILEQYGKAQGDSIPRNVFHECKGLVILTVYKAAFIIGAQGGEGLVVMRRGKKWSPPSGISGGRFGAGLCAFAEYGGGGEAVYAKRKLYEQRGGGGHGGSGRSRVIGGGGDGECASLYLQF